MKSEMGMVACWEAQSLDREHGHCEAPGLYPCGGHGPCGIRSAESSREVKIYICKEHHIVIQSSRKPSIGQIKRSLLKMSALGYCAAVVDMPTGWIGRSVGPSMVDTWLLLVP